MELRLIDGAKSPQDSVGTTVYITADGFARWRCAEGRQCLSSNDLRMHVGLGQAAHADALEIHWPSRRADKVNLAGVDRIFPTEEGHN